MHIYRSRLTTKVWSTDLAYFELGLKCKVLLRSNVHRSNLATKCVPKKKAGTESFKEHQIKTNALASIAQTY